jgi:hypothetical protein
MGHNITNLLLCVDDGGFTSLRNRCIYDGTKSRTIYFKIRNTTKEYYMKRFLELRKILSEEEYIRVERWYNKEGS